MQTFSVERMKHSSSQGQTYLFLAFPSLILLPYLEENSIFLKVAFRGLVDTCLDQAIMGLSKLL